MREAFKFDENKPCLDWYISKKQLAEEKAKAIAEHERYIKTEYAMEIFAEIESIGKVEVGVFLYHHEVAELKKKYTEERK